MPYELAREPFGVHKRLSGFISAEEFLASAAAVEEHPRFHEARYVINDFSDVTGHALTDADFANLAMRKHDAHAKNPRCRIFYVAADEALARLVKKHLVDCPLAGYEVVIVDTLADARHWLATRPGRFRLSRGYGYRHYLAK